MELQPTIQSLFDMVHGVSRELVSTIKSVDRVRVQLSPKHLNEYKVDPTRTLIGWKVLLYRRDRCLYLLRWLPSMR